MSGVGSRRTSGAPSAFLSFCGGALLGPEVGHRGGHARSRRPSVGAGHDRRFHLGRRLDRDNLDAGRARAGDGGDEGYAGAARAANSAAMA